MRNFELPGRSPVHAMNAMVATSHPLATLTALNFLQAGGNAMDAAVAACAVQCVVEPQSTGIGGDCFALYVPGGSDRVIAFNGSGGAPAAATAKWFQSQGIRSIERQTPHAVTIPGAIDAWVQLLETFGTLSLAEVLRPAIAYAREGYPIHARVLFDWSQEVDALRADPEARRVFLPDDRLPTLGSLHYQPDLADTLERIAAEGRDGFYRGPLAERMVEFLQGLGGRHSLEDFAQARGEFVEPIKTEYGGYEIYECPPNGQGIVALEILNILSGFDLAALNPLSSERLHLEIEASRLAYANRSACLADPAKAPVPVDHWLSEAHAAAQRRQISAERALPGLVPASLPVHADTVYLSVVDKERNAVSFINSLFYSFGTALMAPGTGVLLHNRGCGFVVEPGHPNCIGPGKRPLHTIIPAMVCRDGRAVMPFGVMGGQYQATGHAHFITNWLDFEMDPQAAIDAPRVFPALDGSVQVESGVAAGTVEALERLGHHTVRPPKPLGGAQAILIDPVTGVLTGGSDPRKDGSALGY